MQWPDTSSDAPFLMVHKDEPEGMVCGALGLALALPAPCPDVDMTLEDPVCASWRLSISGPGQPMDTSVDNDVDLGLATDIDMDATLGTQVKSTNWPTVSGNTKRSPYRMVRKVT